MVSLATFLGFPKCYIFLLCHNIKLAAQHTVCVSLCKAVYMSELPSSQQLNIRDPTLVTSFASLGGGIHNLQKLTPLANSRTVTIHCIIVPSTRRFYQPQPLLSDACWGLLKAGMGWLQLSYLILFHVGSCPLLCGPAHGESRVLSKSRKQNLVTSIVFAAVSY